MHQKSVLQQGLTDIQRPPKNPQMGDSRLINYEISVIMSICVSLARQSEVYNRFIKGQTTRSLSKKKKDQKTNLKYISMVRHRFQKEEIIMSLKWGKNNMR